MWTAGTLADPALIEWSQARRDNGLCALQVLSDAINYSADYSAETDVTQSLIKAARKQFALPRSDMS